GLAAGHPARIGEDELSELTVGRHGALLGTTIVSRLTKNRQRVRTSPAPNAYGVLAASSTWPRPPAARSCERPRTRSVEPRWPCSRPVTHRAGSATAARRPISATSLGETWLHTTWSNGPCARARAASITSR